MPITRSTNVSYTILNASIMDSGCLNVSVNVTVDSVTSFSTTFIIPQVDTSNILDTTISDGKNIRESLTYRIYDYLVSSGQIAGAIS